MRINEKNLISFATSKTTIDREGWLNKRGEVNKSFQRRWFVLKGNLLFYFERKEDKEPIGLIILEGCTTELAENEDANAFKLVFHGAGNRSYVLAASTQDETEDWMKIIACSSYDYMKLMVTELQRQYDKALHMEKEAKSSLENQLRAGGLPLNRSDSCLFSRADSSAKITRFNPFDKMPLENDRQDLLTSAIQKSEAVEGARMSCAVSEDDLLRHNCHMGLKTNRKKYLFLEMHEYYGQIFRRYFEEQRKKRTAVHEEQLIKFD